MQEMMSRMVKKNSRGFTLIEMLIVIVVIAILAMIVIPRLLGAGRKAKESALRGDLQQLRNAIQQFEADCGDFPAAITQLMTAPAAGSSGGNGIALDAGAWKGPYLRTADGGLPRDPFTAAADWTYDPPSGDVHSASTLTALDGTAYSAW
jgi:type II secretion system protein G